MTRHPIAEPALDQLFLKARTQYGWTADPVSDADLRALYDVMKMGPTSANCSPARLVFCKSEAARARLAACVSDANRPKVLAAPVTAIIGMDLRFHDRLPELFPHADARAWFAGDDAKIYETAFRNSSLQGAYFILAARALGFDTGPMSGFDGGAINAAFFAGTSIEVNFICSLGTGNGKGLFPRLPRLAFEDATQTL